MAPGSAVKKPIEITFMQFDGDNDTDITIWTNGKAFESSALSGPEIPRKRIMVLTLEGAIFAEVGDYIIKGIAGEFYPCKPEIFERTYTIIERGK